MENNNKERKSEGALDSFEPGGVSGPVEDRSVRESRLNSLPTQQDAVARESARFADLCQYFEQEKIDVPPDILDELSRASALPLAERAEAMKKLNRRVMEYLDDVGQDSGIRQ